MSATVGLFGLGLIGAAAAGRLAAAGFALVGCDPDPARGAALTALGGRAVADPEAVWEAAEVVVVAVFDVAQVEAVVAGAPGRRPCRAIVATTCDPGRLAALGPAAAARGIALVEAAVSGTSGQLADGEALLLTGGSEADLAAVDPILAALAPRRRRIGPLGAAARAKLVVNLVLGLNRAALAEGLVLAERLGLDPAGMLGLLAESAAASAVLAVKGPAMVAGDFAPRGRVRQSAKDFDLILAEAARAGQALPLAHAYRGLMADLLAAGEGESDNAAVIAAVRRRRAEPGPGTVDTIHDPRFTLGVSRGVPPRTGDEIG